MAPRRALAPAALALAALAASASATGAAEEHEYCVIGGGPGGLQVAYGLLKDGRDFVVLERAPSVGAFFEEYPRHRKLISINKVYTGRADPEYNMRHDWNSLITDESAPLFSEFTEDYWPSADLYPRYLERFAEQRGLSAHLRLNANVTEVRRDGPALPSSAVAEDFLISTVPSSDGQPSGAEATQYRCGAVIVATGRWTPKYGEGAPMPEWDGSENFEGYEDLDTDLEGYRNKSVLIVGGGNSAFETADAVSGVASFVHVFARSLRFAYQTHYVGDLRATNHEMLDRYLLKSQDAILSVLIYKSRSFNRKSRFFNDSSIDNEDSFN